MSLRENTLSSICQALKDNRRYGLANCRFLIPWSALVRLLQLNKLFPSSRFKDFDYGENIDPKQANHTVEAVSGAFMVVRREALEQVRLLDEGIFYVLRRFRLVQTVRIGGLAVWFCAGR